MKYYGNRRPYSELEKENIEKKIYEETFFFKKNIKKVTINYSKIIQRKSVLLADYDYNLPQNIFIIKAKGTKEIVGRKIISPLWFSKKINAMNCSMITAPMLLGILKSRKKINRKIIIEYFPFFNEEKQGVFDNLKKDFTSDILYPYQYRDFKTKKVKTSSKKGWRFSLKKKKNLSYGEGHIRKFTKGYFSYLENEVIYDPACSTGEFLLSLKKNHPKIFTIGHDLSREMINYASRYVDQAYCCDASNSPLANKSVDIMFLRFLNDEIVTNKKAYKIMRKLKDKIKAKGLIVAFGHTPVLMRKRWLLANGFKILNSIGYDAYYDAIFQYYVLAKEK